MSLLQKIVDFWPEFAARLTAKSDREPITTMTALHRFVATRSAFVAQKTLYGYLKTRMGTRYPTVFEDDQMIASINIAKMHVYAACVADLAIFCAAHTFAGPETDDETCRRISQESYDHAIAENVDELVDAAQKAAWRDAFVARLAGTDWQGSAVDAEQGIESPAALLKWAPIAPELKKFDVEVVHNSVRFAWHDVRAQFRKRIDTASIAAALDTGL